MRDKQRLFKWIGGGLCVILMAVWAVAGHFNREDALVPLQTPPPAAQKPVEAARVKVYIVGAVMRPGVYELPPDARIEDAVAAAGGFAEDADPRSVNLAAKMSDGQQITVRAIDEAYAATDASGAANGGKININAATAEELTRLPNIGPVIAAAIVAYREEHGAFASVDDLLNVGRVGEKTLESIRDQITVD